MTKTCAVLLLVRWWRPNIVRYVAEKRGRRQNKNRRLLLNPLPRMESNNMIMIGIWCMREERNEMERRIMHWLRSRGLNTSDKKEGRMAAWKGVVEKRKKEKENLKEGFRDEQSVSTSINSRTGRLSVIYFHVRQGLKMYLTSTKCAVVFRE